MFALGERAEDKRFDGPRQVSGQHFQFVYPVTDVDEGKSCIGPGDMNDAASLLFGEISPEGVTKMFGEGRLKVKLFIHFVFVRTGGRYIYTYTHIQGSESRRVVDLGMGCGKLVLQVWDEFPNLEHVTGIELAKPRFSQLYKTKRVELH